VTDRKTLYTIGAISALTAVLVGIVETSLTFLPEGTSAGTVTVVDWVDLFERSPFMALRNLGLLNMLFNITAIPAYLALYAAHRGGKRTYATLALAIALIGVAVFFGTNRALPMLDLSNRYAAATTDAERAHLVAAGQAMLSVGQSHTPGTFPAFFFADLSGILMSVSMLRGKVFSRVNAILGIVGFALLLVYEVLASFVSGLDGVAWVIVMFGGLSSTVWYVLSALRLFRLENTSKRE
jgi:hypothetical protein